jgi:multidrug efflux pump subunit AcrA (membrane-fusion protein)
LNPDGQEALRVSVTLGRSSVSTIEIVNGLKEGDQVILSDTSSMDSYNRIRVR